MYAVGGAGPADTVGVCARKAGACATTARGAKPVNAELLPALDAFFALPPPS